MNKFLKILFVVIILTAVAFLLNYLMEKTKFYPVKNWKNYTNSDYGFKLTFPNSWKGFNVVKSSWEGRVIDTGEQKYSGVELVIKNPQTTASQQFQDIPIMVFTHDVWNMVGDEQNATVAVSAAPIPPAKVGENSRYVFATPPRWYGFTDAIGFQEAVNIVKTFKAF